MEKGVERFSGLSVVWLKRLSLIIAGVLAFVFLNGWMENCFNYSNDELRLPYCVALPDNTEMVAFADHLPWNGETDKPDYKSRQIYLYAIDGSSLNNKKLIYMKGYGKFSESQHMNEMVELIDNPDNTLWQVYSEARKFDVKFLSSGDFLKKGLQIGELKAGPQWEVDYSLLINMNSDGSFIMTHFGDIVYPKQELQGLFFPDSYYQQDGSIFNKDDNYFSIYGACLISDNFAVMQAIGKEVKVGDNSTDYYENGLFFVSTIGKSFVIRDGIYPRYENSLYLSNSPLGVSENKEKVAYWVINYDKKEGATLWLSTIRVSDKKIERIVELSKMPWTSDRLKYRWEKVFIRYSPDKSRPLIATTVEGKIIIVDVNAKKIIREIAIKMPRSVRWSSDGKKLGFLIDDMIYSYNIEKDTLTQVGRIKGCFDFLWVPEGGG